MNGPLADYYHWEETGRGIRIYMHSGMVDRLQAEVWRSAASGPEGGTETGGILLGRVETEQGKTIVVVDHFAPVECSYRGGRLYDVSGDDSLNLEAALLRAALAGCESPAAPSILGYYRSHLREGMALSSADLQVIESYFQAPSSVFLLVKTVAGGKACTAGFFFWEDGSIQSEFASLEAALGRTPDQAVPAGAPEPSGDSQTSLDDPSAGLPAGLAGRFSIPGLFEPTDPQSPEPELPSVAPASMSPVAAAPSAPPQPPVRLASPWLGLLVRAATIVIATAALVIAVIAYLGAPRAPREEAAVIRPASVLGLRVERNPPDLLVSWDCNTREVVAARRATLSIRDGERQRPKILNLDKTDILRGSYLYAPSSDDIQFRLEVFEADGGSIAQSIRVSGNSR